MSDLQKCPNGLFTEWEKSLSRSIPNVTSDFEQFYALLVKWQKVQNLVSRETLHEFWVRHVADSIQALTYLRPEDAHIFDLGSGGGFPALPLAIASKNGPHQFMLVESNGRKVSFLRTVARELQLPVKVLNARIEALDSRETGVANVIMARALAPLGQLFAYAQPLLAPKGRMLFHKGREYVEELTESGAEWRFDVVVIASKTDPNGVLLEISNLQPR